MEVSIMGFGVLAYMVGLASSIPTTSACPSLNSSTFVVNAFQLYPENAKFDPVRCLVYFGYITHTSPLYIYMQSSRFCMFLD